MRPLSEQIHDVAEAIRHAVVSGSDEDPRPCSTTLDQWAAEVAALETRIKALMQANAKAAILRGEDLERIEALEKALRQIARGTIRRGRNVSYGGGREGTMTRKEMMGLAALAKEKKP